MALLCRGSERNPWCTELTVFQTNKHELVSADKRLLALGLLMRTECSAVESHGKGLGYCLSYWLCRRKRPSWVTLRHTFQCKEIAEWVTVCWGIRTDLLLQAKALAAETSWPTNVRKSAVEASDICSHTVCDSSCVCAWKWRVMCKERIKWPKKSEMGREGQ